VDPNKALADLRQAYSDWEDTRGRDGTSTAAVDAADRMRDAASALDEWLSRGGFLPMEWAPKQERHHAP
jgi:dsDNA-binding SOS-regulon protein